MDKVYPYVVLGAFFIMGFMGSFQSYFNTKNNDFDMRF
jgi:hypothetical protein